MPVPESSYLSAVWREGIFKDRVVFVTGGAGSICSAQTRALVRLGANACIVGRNADKTEAVARDIETVRRGAKVLGLGNCDVRNLESLQTAVEICVEQLGAIDFVIAGAAGNFIVPMSAMSTNAFKSVMDIDAVGTFNTIKATMPYLVASAKRNKTAQDGLTGGRFVAVSATFHKTGMPLQAHVMAAKAAVEMLCASVALEYGPMGVMGNAIAPGPIAATEGMERLSSVKDDETARSIPAGRWGTVRDVADATVYLFSDAGSYVNGQVLVVDGAAWRRQGGDGSYVGVDPGMKYPDYLLTGQFSSRVKSGRSKL